MSCKARKENNMSRTSVRWELFYCSATQ